MLELKLCGKEDANTAATLLVKAHAPTDAAPEDIYGYYLDLRKADFQALLSSTSPSRVIILGVADDGVVRAAYELPRITRPDGVRDLTLIRGYIAAEPVLKGFGSALFAGVTRVLEQVAFESGEPITHLPETSFRHTTDFFLKRGYEVIRTVDGIPTAIYYLKKVILPRGHELAPTECSIVSAIMHIASLEPISLPARL